MVRDGLLSQVIIVQSIHSIVDQFISSSLDCSIWHSFCSFPNSLQSNVLAKGVAFFYDVIVVRKKVPVEKESELSRGWAITFLSLFHQNHIHCQTTHI